MAPSGRAWSDQRWNDVDWVEATWRVVKISSPGRRWRPKSPGVTRLSAALLSLVVMASLLKLSYLVSSRHDMAPLSAPYLQWGSFEPTDFPGFVNSGLLEGRSCEALRYNGTIGVQKSRQVCDNLEQIALSLDGHPAVAYSEETLSNPSLKFSDIVSQKWARLSGSAVWLPDQGVFLVVTRVIFLGEKENLSQPKASFLRGQLFDENWAHLENCSIDWNGEVVTFPTIFEVPTMYEGGEEECCYGPEDPRIILEDGVLGAEPVIVFNMVHQRSDWKRAMYVFRPFSNQTAILNIRDTTRENVEKNWTPFFLSASHDLEVTPPSALPDEYLHFVYNFKPLKILKCHLLSGDCDAVFEQQLPPDFATPHHEDGGTLHGGTNLVALPIPRSAGVHAGVRAYVGLPRTRVTEKCGRRGDAIFLRPEFVVLVAFRGQFHLAYASEALEFGDAFVELTPDVDPCERGRILIANSISSWDTEQDVMTITGSVDDVTVQVARLYGLLSFVRGLPQWRGMLQKDGPLNHGNRDEVNQLASWVGDDVRACAVESALNYTLAMGKMHDLRFLVPEDADRVLHPT